MYILAFILFFVVGSIIAACDGDSSGLVAIGKIVGFLILLFGAMWLFLHPVLLVIVIIILIAIVCVTSH